MNFIRTQDTHKEIKLFHSINLTSFEHNGFKDPKSHVNLRKYELGLLI